MSGFRRADDPVYPPRKVMQDARTHALGLTIREHFAAMAMRCITGMALDHNNKPQREYYERAAACAVVAADALIAELAK